MSFPVSHYPHPSGNQSRDSLLEPLTQAQTQTQAQTYPAMPPRIMGGPHALIPTKGIIAVASSYILDWAVLVVLAVTGYIMAEVTPNKRPFWLGNPDISYVPALSAPSVTLTRPLRATLTDTLSACQIPLYQK